MPNDAHTLHMIMSMYMSGTKARIIADGIKHTHTCTHQKHKGIHAPRLHCEGNLCHSFRSASYFFLSSTG